MSFLLNNWCDSVTQYTLKCNLLPSSLTVANEWLRANYEIIGHLVYLRNPLVSLCYSISSQSLVLFCAVSSFYLLCQSLSDLCLHFSSPHPPHRNVCFFLSSHNTKTTSWLDPRLAKKAKPPEECREDGESEWPVCSFETISLRSSESNKSVGISRSVLSLRFLLFLHLLPLPNSPFKPAFPCPRKR